MPESILDNKEICPDDNSLKGALGASAVLWQDIKEELTREYGELIEDWKFYNKKSGWILKFLRKKRNLFFLIPQVKHFKITFVFGDRAVDAVEQSDLPEDIKKTLRSARKYAEGRGLQLAVKTADDVEHVKKLVAIKLSA